MMHIARLGTTSTAQALVRVFSCFWSNICSEGPCSLQCGMASLAGVIADGPGLSEAQYQLFFLERPVFLKLFLACLSETENERINFPKDVGFGYV